MEDNTRYYKDPPRLIRDLMEDTLGDKYQYFLGSPTMLAQEAYPCVIIQPINSANTTNGAPTGQDIVVETINIHILVLDQQIAASQGMSDTTIRHLYQTVQGRDPATKAYMTGTVLYALRTNNDLGTALIDSDISVDYMANRDDSGKIIMEAIITIDTKERVSIPDRIAAGV